MRNHNRLAISAIAGLLAGTAIALSLSSAAAGPLGFTGTPLFLPAVMRSDPPTATPTPTDTPTPPPTEAPPPMPGQNAQCQTNGAAQICASVSDANPARYTTVTVYGRLLISGAGQAGQAMSATWHYKTTTPSCGGTTDSSGNAQCSRYISGATAGYQVNVDVSIDGYGATTRFTPQ